MPEVEGWFQSRLREIVKLDVRAASICLDLALVSISSVWAGS